MWRRSITLRLTLHFGIASAAVLLTIGYLVGVAVERHFVDLDRIEINGKMELVRHVLSKLAPDGDVATLADRMDDALTGHPSLGVRIATLDGRTIYTSQGGQFAPEMLGGDASSQSAGDELATWMHDGHEYRGFTRTVATYSAKVPNVFVSVAVATDEHHKFMVVLYRNLWLAVVAGIVATAVLGWVAARRGMAPVREMARVAHRVTASRLDNRLPVATLPIELQELAEAFNEMLSRLEDSFRRLSEFSSDLAHELRTPIANLITQTHVALARPRCAVEYREVLYSNAEEFDRLARMITDMLFLAKADHGLVVPRSETIDLANEVRELFEFYDALAEDQGVSLSVAGDGSVKGDRLMIRRAISNLLSNAIGHTPRGGTVSVQIEPTGDGAMRLSVDNPGEGIAAEHLPRLFDRFYRIDSSRKRSTEGAGLGLAITQSIIAAHRGSVRVESADGKTRFEVILPATIAS